MNDNSTEFLEGLLEPPSNTRWQDRVRRVMDQIRGIKNWPEVLSIRKQPGEYTAGIVQVSFRDGWEIEVREGTLDIFVVWEVALAGGYGSAQRILRNAPSPCCVLDLGGHIGSFSLRVSRLAPNAQVHVYEPEPANRALLQRNLSLNPVIANRIRVFDEAVAAEDGTACFHVDPTNTGAGRLDSGQNGAIVKTVSLKTAVDRCDHPVALLKLDVEGAEYAILEQTATQVWERIPAILAEVHPDPSGKCPAVEWLRRMQKMGYSRLSRDFSNVVMERE